MEGWSSTLPRYKLLIESHGQGYHKHNFCRVVLPPPHLSAFRNLMKLHRRQRNVGLHSHVDRNTLIILESKNCPEHVRGIENLDTAVTLESILADLEDMGEAAKDV